MYDWDEVLRDAERQPGAGPGGEDRLIVNMGPQHPSTHGVLRLILEIEGESVIEARCGIGYLHTGIEKNLEFRNWTQAVTFLTRADYLMPLFNETVYCRAVEALLGVEADVPPRAEVIRVLLMELNRISSHLVAIATGGMELGATTVMTNGFRDREPILDILETITGNRMNHAYVRPGGLVQDLPDGVVEDIRTLIAEFPKRLRDYERLLNGSPVFQGRTKGVGYLDLAGCMALGVTGPMLRATGLPHDLRKAEPYLGYDTYEFDVPTETGCDAYSRYVVRFNEMAESLRIIGQALDRLEPGPVMLADPKIAWPARLALGSSDGLGTSEEWVRHIMAQSMEALIHHFKLVTEGFAVPAGQVYSAVESPRGELGAHVVSDGGTRPFRVHLRDPSFTHLAAVPAMAEGGMLADVVAVVASVDPVLGGADR
ncbi:NADH-quinone oxidoreductase subunit D [Catenulispora sp. NF23]|uniref:NADH-quinone oxidoreductase subunit D n=1 Tax=Catenulispora pinistramenti TaxID=2705254 RepID=A0ABS5L4C1_9ACTN|nr:NADH-quinone oxidoreductase subunit D [Catenulispora pinistramenti]MBS2539182.1 NADH-quinone oxidoreductase subunit D [Catenulispora pinistramenti]MBS2553208.1 NADH-quinone oxidoreductase subunit D [Catenulispora pinistramenti]